MKLPKVEASVEPPTAARSKRSSLIAAPLAPAAPGARADRHEGGGASDAGMAGRRRHQVPLPHPRGKTATARRWVNFPEWLMGEIIETCPPDDRTPERRVFPGATRQVLGMAMRRGCQAAGLALYSPHDLRHRYASVKVKEGVPVTEFSAQLDHARKSMTLDTYSHVLLNES